MKIDSFSGEYGFLSNFCDSLVFLDEEAYRSVEHAFQAAKCAYMNAREPFKYGGALTPGQAKRAGRKVRLRADWEDVKIDVMRKLLASKFAHPDLADLLVATGDADLVEGNRWGDTFWGVCDGVGLNWLGVLLMERRATLIATRADQGGGGSDGKRGADGGVEE